MINFNRSQLTEIALLTKEEAIIFCIFIWSEKFRHMKDIEDIAALIERAEKLHNFNIADEYIKRVEII